MKLTEKEIRIKIKNIFLVILGTFILAFGTAIFLVPSDLVTGGMSGIAIVANAIYEIPTGSLPFNSIDIYVFILEWVLFFLGLIFLGKEFTLKTLLSVILFPIFLALCQKLVSKDVFNGFFIINDEGYTSIILCALFGGICNGAGVAVTFIGGGSTGGLDILALILCKIFKRCKNSVMIFVLDAAVVILGVFVLKDFILSLLGIIAAILCAFFVDKIFLGQTQAFTAHIISEKWDEISKALIEATDRSTTIVDVVGGYTGTPRKMIIISYTIDNYALVNKIVSLIDKKAFMTITRAHEINGEGWTRPSPKKENKDEGNNN